MSTGGPLFALGAALAGGGVSGLVFFGLLHLISRPGSLYYKGVSGTAFRRAIIVCTTSLTIGLVLMVIAAATDPPATRSTLRVSR